MGKSLAYKLIEMNRHSGNLSQGSEVTLKVQQTLTQDSTGTMVYLQLAAMNIDQVKTEKSVAYIDHNTLQTGFENADDHEFIKTSAARYGIVYSKPGGGICHQVHLERFGIPGKVLLGSDSHTPTGGALGMLAIGAGGLDVAVAMAKGTYSFKMPKVINVHLIGQLQPWVTAKDVILAVLKELTVKGGVGAIMEYSGPGVESLSLTDRATITNMGAELGATTSVFPSDKQTLDFLTRQGRFNDYIPLSADLDAHYDARLMLDLTSLTPLAACPHSPDNISPVAALKSIPVDQVAIGSCTNSSYTDMMKVAGILKGRKVHPNVSLVIAPGSASILKMLAENGSLAHMISAGARILESACGPCIGMGQSPKSGAVSLRTFNRNFKGRSGTENADVYLVSPETAAVSALSGFITNPATFGSPLHIELPQIFSLEDHYFIEPPKDGSTIEVIMGPNIKPFPTGQALKEDLQAKVILKVGDNITTDDIMPSNAKLLPYRSNIPELSKSCFKPIDPDFNHRALANGGGFILGGDNYGQGSSREHAALVPLYLGVRAVVAKSFARIHRSNLINAGIVPLVFVNSEDYDDHQLMDPLSIEGIFKGLQQAASASEALQITCSLSKVPTFNVHDTVAPTAKSLITTTLSPREAGILLAGGYLNYCSQQDL